MERSPRMKLCGMLLAKAFAIRDMSGDAHRVERLFVDLGSQSVEFRKLKATMATGLGSRLSPNIVQAGVYLG